MGADLTLWVESDVPSDDIVAVCCFVIDESQIRVGRGTAPPHRRPRRTPRCRPRNRPPPRNRRAPRCSRRRRGTATGGIGTGRTRARRAGRRRASAASGPAGGAADHAPQAAAHHDDKRARPAAAAASGAEGSSIRVGVEKVDQLINLVGGVITQAMLAETASAFDPALHDRLFNGWRSSSATRATCRKR